MAGLKVVAVKVNSDGTLDLHDLRAKAEKHKDNLAAFMVRFSIPTGFILSISWLDNIPFNIRSL